MKRLLLLISFMWSLTTAFGQGNTTAALNGRVVDENSEPLIGATILVTHEPTSTQYGNITDAQGYFRIPNLKAGGPYTVKISFVGFQDNVRSGMMLSVGQSMSLDVTLNDDATELQEIVVSAGGKLNTESTGAETYISEENINAIPTVSRSFGDFAKLDPLANIQEGSDGFAISINGMNNRYNSIYIDGAINNDVFGLAGSGTNGGQTGVTPISLDAIESFQVSVAPFDVRVSGFAGGAINAVTRSGTNEVTGSAYYLWRNENLAGKTPTDNPEVERKKLEPFSAQTFGFRVGGPIIKNKLFLFLNGELQRDETPQPFDFADYQGDADRQDLTNLENKLNGYGYDPGGFENNTAFLNSDKFFLRLDWNINKTHNLMFRHSYTEARNLEALRSSSRTINYLNASEFFKSVTNSTALELTSNWANKSNKFTFGYTRVRDNRNPSGDNFPYVTIQDGSGRINFGSEQFSTANQLDQDIFTITDNFEIFKGPHTITIGTHNEFYKIYNLFIRQNFGSYEYDSLDQYLDDMLASEFNRSYSLVDDITGDGSAAASIFNAYQFGLYIQDEWKLGNVTLTGGLRGDLFVYPDNTAENEYFNNVTKGLIEGFGYDLKGATTGKFVDPQFMFSPRFGFNWDVNGDRTFIIRGGMGVFTSRVPLVWPGGAYNNNGSTVGGDQAFGPSDGTWYREYSGVFNPQWDNQAQRVAPNSGFSSGQVDLFSSNFKVPQVAKFNVAFDNQLPWGLVSTIELIYNKTMSNVFYENVNLKPSEENLTGTGDNRPYFDRRDEIDPTFTRIILASNTSEGYTWNAAFTLTKPFTKGFFGSLSYAYGDAYSIYDGTSSQNSSQWRGLHAINGRNIGDGIQRSDFSTGHRILLNLSYRKEYADHFASQLSIFWNGQSGSPYSYIVNDRGALNNEDSRERNLFYVPRDRNDIVLIDDVDSDGNIIRTADEQWEDLNQFIESDKYLKSRRGQYAERNKSRVPFISTVDLRFLQDFFITNSSGRRHLLQLSLDVYNFGNILNKDWGRRYFMPFGNFEIVDFEGHDTSGGGRVPQYTFGGVENNEPWSGNIDDSGLVSSRWQMQLGLRYTF